MAQLLWAVQAGPWFLPFTAVACVTTKNKTKTPALSTRGRYCPPENRWSLQEALCQELGQVIHGILPVFGGRCYDSLSLTEKIKFREAHSASNSGSNKDLNPTLPIAKAPVSPYGLFCKCL